MAARTVLGVRGIRGGEGRMIGRRSGLTVAVRSLLVADGLVWATFSVLLGTGVANIGRVGPTATGVIALLMACNAVALGLAAWQVLRGRKVVDYLAVALMAANAVLSLADEIGWADAASFVLSVVILVLLILGIRSGGSQSESARVA
jgi:hypothetical protein